MALPLPPVSPAARLAALAFGLALLASCGGGGGDGGNGVIDPAHLAVAPSTVHISGGEASGTLHVTNMGDLALTWSAAVDSSWLEVVPASGVTPGGATATLTVSADRTGMPSGLRAGALTVDSDGGTALIPVSVEVFPGAALGVDPSELDFGTSATTLALVVSNAGIGTMSWTTVDSLSSSWVSAAPASGVLGAGARDTLDVVVQRGGLGSGEHIGRLDIASDGGFATVGVRLQNP